MVSQLDEARARVREDENPFSAAFKRLRQVVTKSTNDDDDDDEGLAKSRGGKVATFDGLASGGHGSADEASRRRAASPSEHAGQGASKGLMHDGDDDGDDDFADEDIDQGTADGDDYDTDGEAHEGPQHGELDDDGEDESEHPKGCRCDECRPGKKTMKSLEDGIVSGDPGQEFLQAILNSEYADQIDASEALVYLADRATATIDAQSARIEEMAKSINDIETARAQEMRWVKEALAALADGLHETLLQGQEAAQTTTALLRSVSNIASDVAIVKSQPASGGVPNGVIALPLAKSSSFIPDGQGVAVSKRTIQAALYKSLSSGEIDQNSAASYMERLDGATGLENVYKMLPDAVRRHIG